MKASFLFLFCCVIIFSFILQSCGNENMVTQPSEKPMSKVPMAKVATTPASTTDTVITLKKSGKMLMLPKGLSAKQIGKLDKLLSQNKTPAATASLIQPNAEMCGWLIRRAKQVQYIWKCDYPNPCTSCIWGSTDISMWNVVSWSYTGVEQYFYY